MGSSGEGLSEARLAEIKRAFTRMLNISERGSLSEQFYHAGMEMLAEVERLRAREAALVAVAQAVAGYDVPLWTDEEDQDFMADLDNHWPCIIKTEGLTGRRYHEGPCIIEQARALLASADTAEQAEWNGGKPHSVEACPVCNGPGDCSCACHDAEDTEPTPHEPGEA